MNNGMGIICIMDWLFYGSWNGYSMDHGFQMEPVCCKLEPLKASEACLSCVVKISEIKNSARCVQVSPTMNVLVSVITFLLS